MKVRNREIILSGVFTGISGLFVSMAISDTGAGMGSLILLALSPMFWLSCVCGGLGFTYLQIALHEKDLSLVQPAVSSIAIVTPVVLAVIFLGEYVPPSRWAGVGLLLVGIIGIQKGDSEGMLRRLYGRIRRK